MLKKLNVRMGVKYIDLNDTCLQINKLICKSVEKCIEKKYLLSQNLIFVVGGELIGSIQTTR